MKCYTVDTLKAAFLNEESLLLLDTRGEQSFTQGFIPTSLFLGWGASFSNYASQLLLSNKKIILITEKGKEKEIAKALQILGLPSVLEGYLEGGFEGWKNAGEPIDMIIDIEPDELAMDLPFDNKLVVLDVRMPEELETGAIKNAVNIPVTDLLDPAMLASFDENDALYIHCSCGYRSVIAASVFKQQGYHNLRNVLGGFNAIKNAESLKQYLMNVK